MHGIATSSYRNRLTSAGSLAAWLAARRAVLVKNRSVRRGRRHCENIALSEYAKLANNIAAIPVGGRRREQTITSRTRFMNIQWSLGVGLPCYMATANKISGSTGNIRQCMSNTNAAISTARENRAGRDAFCITRNLLCPRRSRRTMRN